MPAAARPKTLTDLAVSTAVPPSRTVPPAAPQRFLPTTWKLFRVDRPSLRVTVALVVVWALAVVSLLLIRLGLVLSTTGSWGVPWLPPAIALGVSGPLVTVLALRIRWQRSFFHRAREIEGTVRDITSDDKGKSVAVFYKVNGVGFSVCPWLETEKTAEFRVGATATLLFDPNQPDRALLKRAFL